MKSQEERKMEFVAGVAETKIKCSVEENLKGVELHLGKKNLRVMNTCVWMLMMMLLSWMKQMKI